MSTLVTTTQNAVTTVMINKPEVMNAMNDEVMSDLSTTFQELENSVDTRVILLTGAGEKAFVAGGDIRIMQPKTAGEARETALKAQKLLDQIEQCKKPVIALLNGYTLGGGLELAMACDMRIAADHAKLGQPEINLAIIPGFAGTVRLSRLVGKGIAKEMVFTGEMISAKRAYEIGLVNTVVPKEELHTEGAKLAEKIATKSNIALQYAKEAIDNGMEMDSARASVYEADLFGLCFATHDQKEGMQAFIEKRKPKFLDK